MSHKLYFASNIDDERCYTLPAIVEMMKEHDLSETEIQPAQKDAIYDGIFYCKHFDTIGEDGECGTICEGYEPRNGKSGICKHKGHCYEPSEKAFTLKLVKGKPVVREKITAQP